ncbi:MAG: dehydrogenase, partial [Candidatus Electrothrix sp. AR5]|nr:dehydrogenase [Candidatus Electrothrix sp. AR5]
MSNLPIPIEKDGMDEYVHAASQKMGIGKGLSIAKILSKSLDLRNQNQFYYIMSFVVSVRDSYENKQNFPKYTEQIKE